MLALRLSFMFVTLGAPATALAKAPCFLTSSSAYCVFPDGVVNQACEKPDGSEYCALVEGRGKIIHNFSACAGNGMHDEPAAEQRRCAAAFAKFIASLPPSYTWRDEYLRDEVPKPF
jgi:hypothetical protein